MLIYAFREDTLHHEICRPWLRSLVEGDSVFGVSRLTLAAVVRITTNPRIYRQPSTLRERWRFCEYLLEQPHCRTVEPGDRHWGIFKRLCVETDTNGSRVSDAWFAALAIEQGCEWVTFDRGHARSGLKWHTPTAPNGFELQ